MFLPLTKAPIWYDVSKPDIQNIFKFAIRGLEKLKRSYSRNSTINHSIQYYIDCLRKSINLSDEDGGRSNNDNDRRSSRRNRDTEPDTEDEHNTIFNKLKGIWNDREISIINNLLIEMESRRSEEGGDNLNKGTHFLLESDSDTLITTLETLLCAKERKVSDLITRSTTLLE